MPCRRRGAPTRREMRRHGCAGPVAPGKARGVIRRYRDSVAVATGGRVCFPQISTKRGQVSTNRGDLSPFCGNLWKTDPSPDPSCHPDAVHCLVMHGPTIAAAALSPPLKWAGGKRGQVPHLRPLWEPHAHRRLVEPFCGGLAVSLGLMPERALLNDTNPHLVSFYRWLKRGRT